MLELDATNTLAYLHDHGVLDRSCVAQVSPLAWGVSNVVLRVCPKQGADFVIKQSRAQLRTAAPWFSRLDRIWREIGVMRAISPLLPPGVVPRVLFEDRANYLFGMEAAPANHTVWKQLLLEGSADLAVAARLGEYLATIHRQTAGDENLAREFGDLEVFDELRVDPFYRRVAARLPDGAALFDPLIAELFATRACLVHADFSPKNVLISARGITLVDFETGHYGDPAFDLGFFLSHLLLKAVLHSARFETYAELTRVFWRTYRDGIGPVECQPAFAPAELFRRAARHLAGCAWARIDGTSPVDYLPDEQMRASVRRFCRGVLQNIPRDWSELLQRLTTEIYALPRE